MSEIRTINTDNNSEERTYGAGDNKGKPNRKLKDPKEVTTPPKDIKK